MGESPGLVAMGGDSSSEGRVFETKHRILDGHFYIILLCLFEKDEKEKKKRVGILWRSITWAIALTPFLSNDDLQKEKMTQRRSVVQLCLPLVSEGGISKKERKKERK